MTRIPARPPFPWGRPTWPNGVERLPAPRRTGLDYDTAWARRLPARLARAVIVDDILRPIVHALGAPTVHGLDRIADLAGPAIFAANHHSHLDTPLLLASLPPAWRHRAVVAAAADYFFTSRARGAVSALSIGAIPIERHRVNRRSSDLAAQLLGEGWSLVIFPEGGRSRDGWGQDFRGGAAYLAVRCRVPVVPVYVEGTRHILRRGARLPTPVGEPFRRGSGVHVTFGPAVRPDEGEDARRFAVRVHDAVGSLRDEWATDWWSARRRSASGATPALTGPPVSSWRRAWALDGDADRDAPERPWP